MIIDKFNRIRQYAHLLNNLDQAFEAIQPQIINPEAGRYEFAGGFFMVQQGETKPLDEGLFEAHQKYIDVQILLKGQEEMAWAEIDDLTASVPYNTEKDAAYYTGSTKNHMLIDEGMFFVAFPHDGHKAVRHTDEPHSFTKIVLKLPV